MIDEQSDRQQWHELCATFSVKDHTYQGAFIADVLLYDRLIIPVVPTEADGLSSEEAKTEWQRWKDEGKWDPARQTQLVGLLVDKLKDRVVQVPWTKALQEEWRVALGQTQTAGPESINVAVNEEMAKAKKNGFFETGKILEKFAPAMAKTVVAVSPFRSLEELEKQTSLRRVRPAEPVPASSLMAVLGFELFVPHDPDRDDFDLLAEAAEVASDPSYREKRTALYLWQQRFVSSTRETTDPVSIKAAVEEMKTLVEQLKKTTPWRQFKHALMFFKAGTDVVKLASPLGAALGGVVLSIGDFAAQRSLEGSASHNLGTPAAALVLDAQKRLNLTISGERRE